MAKQGSGVILTINAPSDEAVPLAGGFGATCAERVNEFETPGLGN
jgi:hypothetical protein